MALPSDRCTVKVDPVDVTLAMLTASGGVSSSAVTRRLSPWKLPSTCSADKSSAIPGPQGPDVR